MKLERRYLLMGWLLQLITNIQNKYWSDKKFIYAYRFYTAVSPCFPAYFKCRQLLDNCFFVS